MSLEIDRKTLTNSLLQLSLLFCFFVSFGDPSSARETESLLNELRSTQEDYSPIGTVCEQAAKIKLREQFPAPNYAIETGVVYGTRSHSIGELDVVVFNRHTHQVTLIGEVKCWQNTHKALHKANLQRRRFFYTLSTLPKILFYLSKDRQITYGQEQFSTQIPFVLISQQDHESSGFDIILDYTLDELMEVRDKLLSCQKMGACPSRSINPMDR